MIIFIIIRRNRNLETITYNHLFIKRFPQLSVSHTENEPRKENECVRGSTANAASLLEYVVRTLNNLQSII